MLRSICRISVAVALTAILPPVAATAADTLHLDPHAMTAVARIDERFQSYNIEMAEVIGGRFWKPYAHMKASDPRAATIQVGGDPALFEARTPVDLSSHRLRALASGLSPAYLRVSGTWANSVYFQNDDAAAMDQPPDGYRGVLTRAQWQGVVAFSKAVDARLVTSFTISAGVRDPSGSWTPVEAQPLLDFTHSIGGEIYAAELFNEPNLAGYGAGPSHYDAPWFARDVAAFHSLIEKSAPGMKIVGPGDVTTANLSIPGASTAEALMSADPQPKFDVVSYHFYGAVSKRCASPDAPLGTSEAQALTEDWLARTEPSFDTHKALRDRYAPHAPVWITETAQAACGGSPWAATFVDTFRYLDQMGRLARRGADAVFHNTLAASEYGLIDQSTLDPRPSYWAALLWRRLIGTVALDAGPLRPGLHVYAQCLRGRPGGVSLLALNMGDDAATLDVPAPTETYLLTAPSRDSGTVLLNGHSLQLGAKDQLPELRPQRHKGTTLTLPAVSIGFIAVPGANNPGCRRSLVD